MENREDDKSLYDLQGGELIRDALKHYALYNNHNPDDETTYECDELFCNSKGIADIESEDEETQKKKKKQNQKHRNR
jgi:hypothetical protein